MKDYDSMWMKIFMSELGHMTNMATMAYMVKTLKNLLLQN